MPRHTCVCGARYRFPDSSVGKKAKCKKCGAIFELEPDEEGPIPLAADPGIANEFAAAAERAAQAPPAAGPASSGAPAGFAPPPVVIERAEEKTPSALGAYFPALFSTLLFVSRPNNLIVFIIIWPVLCLQQILLPAAPLIGIIGYWIIAGWFCAFRFDVLVEASAGEQDLPAFNPTEGGFEGIVLPLFKWVGSWVVAFLPAFAALIVVVATGTLGLYEVLDMLGGGVGDMVQGAAAAGIIVFAVLTLAGLFMWPLIVLCIAIGGFPSLARIDLLIATMIKTLPIYILTTAIVFGATLIGPVLVNLPGGLVGRILSIGVSLYLEIVALRAIGLYYHHFKHRFAWSWG